MAFAFGAVGSFAASALLIAAAGATFATVVMGPDSAAAVDAFGGAEVVGVVVPAELGFDVLVVVGAFVGAVVVVVVVVVAAPGTEVVAPGRSCVIVVDGPGVGVVVAEAVVVVADVADVVVVTDVEVGAEVVVAAGGVRVPRTANRTAAK